jgi:Rrf2 family protein
MVDLAQHQGEGSIPLKDIAQRHDISGKYLEAIVKLLVQSNLVVGARGKGGGYQLARSAADYSILEILDATEGSLVPVSCLEGDPGNCPKAGQCVTLPMWQGLNQVIQDYLSHISLEQLVEQAAERGITPNLI